MIGFVENYILRRYNIISFDIFDTLIERKCAKPSDIFMITGQIILGESSAEEFRSKRIEAEKKAREKKNYDEVNLMEIYQELKGFDKDLCSKLMEEEMRQEILNCEKKASMESLYEKALRLGKKVILISDMYLSEDTIIEMLTRCGINGYNSIYVSNCHNANKLTGRLFLLVLKDNNIKKNEIIHIGDSVKADYIGARRAGISSILIGRKNRFRRLGGFV